MSDHPGGRAAVLLAWLLGVSLLAGACQGQAERSRQGPPGDDGGSDDVAASGARLRLRGTLRAGVEPGCLLLHADHGGRYLLLGTKAPRLAPGTRVEVGGVPTRARTTCQEGTPLRVLWVRTP